MVQEEANLRDTLLEKCQDGNGHVPEEEEEDLGSIPVSALSSVNFSCMVSHLEDHGVKKIGSFPSKVPIETDARLHEFCR